MALSPALRQALFYAAGIVLMKSASLITLPIVTAHLPPEDYGRLELLVTLADVAGIIIGLGLVEALYRFAGAAMTFPEKRMVAANTFGIALLTSIVAFLATHAAAPAIAAALPGPSMDAHDVRLLLTTLVATTLLQIPLAWMRMRGRAELFLVAVVSKAVLQTILVVYAVRHGYGVTGILSANAVAELVLLALLGIWQWRETGVAAQLKTMRQFLAYSWPLIFGGLALFVMGTFDRWLLADAVGAHEIAFYALAGKFALITALLIKPFEMWWFPRRFELLRHPRGIEKSTRIVTAGVTYVVVVASAAALLGPMLVVALLPVDYHAAVHYLPWVAVVTALQSSAGMLTVGCYAGRTTLGPMAINTSAALVALVGYLTLIPHYGVMGAIFSTLAAQVSRLCLFHYHSQRAIYFPYPARRMLTFAGLAVAAIVWTATLPVPASPAIVVAAVVTLALLAFSLRLLPSPRTLLLHERLA